MKEKDEQIKTLNEQMLQYTQEMEQHAQFMEGLKRSAQQERGGWIMALHETFFWFLIRFSLALSQLSVILRSLCFPESDQKSAEQVRKMEALKAKLNAAERRAAEAEEAAKVAEAHAEHKDQALVEAVKRLNQFLSVSPVCFIFTFSCPRSSSV